MGGSRGSGTPRIPLSELQKTKDEREKQDAYDREVNKFLESLFKQINSRDTEQINKHLETLKGALEKDIENSIEMRFGGSLNKHTYVNGLSDIDMLVQINNSSYQDKSPQELLSIFAEKISKRLPNTEVSIGKLAVTVKYSNGNEIQLLPSLKTQTGYKIPSIGSDKWSNVIKPHKFAEKLTKVNRENGNRVVPLIKLFKSINSSAPKSKQLSGYHIESLAINAFKNSDSTPRTFKGMVEYFVRFSKNAVLESVKDSTGQSIHVDDYLGARNSPDRKRISISLKVLEKRIKNANDNQINRVWNDLLGK
ncbi:CBASS oligonucleotide cyclase [Alkalihalobacillus sp. TS-13]|uniref:CBASS oligonucleotide cyclase n=1 Tax=Alkalihalobacillus sp. TS-13 TaxID=2842455 RepID=UPI001C8756DA|nr:CBASS oligonucleotide cyclase [Alkalihalobacillus sp. TS-13]